MSLTLGVYLHCIFIIPNNGIESTMFERIFIELDAMRCSFVCLSFSMSGSEETG